MSKPRKTIEVESVKEMANNFLANSRDDRRDQRFGICSLVEVVLQATDNYKGFSYLYLGSEIQDESRRRYS